MTCHSTLPFHGSPSLAPLSIPQRNFLALHARYFVERYRWYFSQTQLRAFAGTESATLWRDELDDLVARGLMQYGVGCADVRILPAGVGAVMQEQKA
jgi:hypothetical protein